jgi:predicted nucleic-acid-binding Zn-ribbon protein
MESMKNTGTCPKCRNTNLLHIPQVAANTDTGTSQMQPPFRLAVTGRGYAGCSGELQAFACPRCGLVELYLAERLAADGVYVREVSVPAQGPHRT